MTSLAHLGSGGRTKVTARRLLLTVVAIALLVVFVPACGDPGNDSGANYSPTTDDGSGNTPSDENAAPNTDSPTSAVVLTKEEAASALETDGVERYLTSRMTLNDCGEPTECVDYEVDTASCRRLDEAAVTCSVTLAVESEDNTCTLDFDVTKTAPTTASGSSPGSGPDYGSGGGEFEYTPSNEDECASAVESVGGDLITGL